MRRRGGIVYASRIFPRHEAVGYDQQGSRRYRGAHPSSRCGPPRRPTPSSSSTGSAILLRRAAPERQTRGPLGSGQPSGPSFPIGGHIHFSGIDLTTELLRAQTTTSPFP